MIFVWVVLYKKTEQECDVDSDRRRRTVTDSEVQLCGSTFHAATVWLINVFWGCSRQVDDRLAQLDKACAYGARDWGFESLVGHFLFCFLVACCVDEVFTGFEIF